MELRPLEKGLRRPKQPLRLRRRRDRGGIVSKDARLQLADPVPVSGVHQMRIRFQVTLELLLVEAGVIEAAELGRQAAQRPDQLELPGDPVDGQIDPCLAREFEPGLGLPLHLGKRIATREKMRHEVMTAKAGVVEVANLLRRVEGPSQQRPARPDMPRPAAEARDRRGP